MSGKKYEIHLEIRPPRQLLFPRGKTVEAVIYLSEDDVTLARGFMGGTAEDSIVASTRLARIGHSLVNLTHAAVVAAMDAMDDEQ